MQSLQLWFETRQGVRLENVNTKNDLPDSVVNNDRDGAHADTKVYTSSVDRLSNTSVLRHGVVREQTHGEGNVRSHKDSEADSCEDKLQEICAVGLRKSAESPEDGTHRPDPLPWVLVSQNSEE